MKQVKKLSFKVGFSFSLNNVEVPRDVYDSLCEAYDNHKDITTYTLEYNETAQWLSENINLEDAMDMEFSLDELED